jgi:hypothetical protein
MIMKKNVLEKPIVVKSAGEFKKDLRIVSITPCAEDAIDNREDIRILTGSKRKPDYLSISGGPVKNGDRVVFCQGLFNGRYADAEVYSRDLIVAIEDHAPNYVRWLKKLLSEWEYSSFDT